jgi:hypothetical protein
VSQPVEYFNGLLGLKAWEVSEQSKEQALLVGVAARGDNKQMPMPAVQSSPGMGESSGGSDGAIHIAMNPGSDAAKLVGQSAE